VWQPGVRFIERYLPEAVREPLPWRGARRYPGTPPAGPGTVTRIVSWGS